MQQNNLRVLHGTATCAVYYVNSQGKPNAQDKDLLVSTFKKEHLLLSSVQRGEPMFITSTFYLSATYVQNSVQVTNE